MDDSAGEKLIYSCRISSVGFKKEVRGLDFFYKAYLTDKCLIIKAFFIFPFTIKKIFYHQITNFEWMRKYAFEGIGIEYKTESGKEKYLSLQRFTLVNKKSEDVLDSIFQLLKKKTNVYAKFG